jgi:transcriptional regulator with XRE-family HTH domain
VSELSDLLKLVGEQLRIIRESKKLTQAQVAERTGSDGMTKSRISDIERGKTNISLKTLERLLQALEVTPVELFHFQKLDGLMDIEEKKILLEVHKFALMERDLGEVKYVVRTARDFLNTIDAKKS